MPKTVSIRIDDVVYRKIKSAAVADRRPIANYIENATLSYLESSAFVDNSEMAEILADKRLVRNLRAAMTDVKKGKYRLVR